MRLILTEQDEVSITAENGTYVPIDVIVENGKVTTSFYAGALLELRKCGGEYRMFQFNNLEEYRNYDFGYFIDEETIWNNIASYKLK